jgi:hypothetical protein
MRFDMTVTVRRPALVKKWRRKCSGRRPLRQQEQTEEQTEEQKETARLQINAFQTHSPIPNLKSEKSEVFFQFRMNQKSSLKLTSKVTNPLEIASYNLFNIKLIMMQPKLKLFSHFKIVCFRTNQFSTND